LIKYFFFVCVLSCSSLVRAQCDYDKKIIFAGLDWDSNRFHNEVARFILEKGYNCKTDVIPGSSFPMLAALGKGDVHIMMEVWRDNIREAWAKMINSGQVVNGGVNFNDAVQGFYVPTYVIKGDPERGIKPIAPDLKSVADLPKYREIFKDQEVPNKGRFYNCILGWTCESINTKKLKTYGLDKYYTNFRPGASAALAAAIAGAYAKGQPILAYYWGPTWVLGKYDLTMIEEPPYDEKIWQKFVEEESPTQATAFPVIKVYKGFNASFTKEAPGVVAFIKRYKMTGKLISESLTYLQNNKGSNISDAAQDFLKNRTEIWSAWVSPIVAEKIERELKIETTKEESWVLKIDEPINDFVSYFVAEYEGVFSILSRPLLLMIISTEKLLKFLPWWLFVFLVATLCYLIEPGMRLPVISILCLLVLLVLGLWGKALDTLALMIIATFVSVIIGIPVGVLISMSKRIRSLVFPILDAMQTMPSFVYLIPALMLFGLGKVPALFATVIYAVTPLIRLTCHGIQIVDQQVVEASRAFGASKWQMLSGVQIPLALPTIMAGVNQTTMLALSMVVIASMIGARGLGEQVLLGIQKLDVGQGFTAGIGIVVLAILLDRTSQAAGRRINPVK